MKVLINTCYGGFSLSEAVYRELDIPWDGYGYLTRDLLGVGSNSGDYVGRGDDRVRSCPRLIAAVEKVGLKESSGALASLAIVEIPDGVDYEIEEYDGREWVAEVHRTWHA